MNSLRLSVLALCASLALFSQSELFAADDACQGIKLSTSVAANTLKGGDRLQLSVFPDTVPGSPGQGTSNLELVVHTNKRELARSIGGKIEFTIPTDFSDRDPSIILVMGDGYDELALDLSECVPGWSITGFGIDSTPPTITSILTPQLGQERNRFLTEILVNTKDSNSGVELITLEVLDRIDRKIAQGELKLSASDRNGKEFFAVPIKLNVGTSGGVYRFVVTVMDRAGNSTTQTLIANINDSVYVESPPPPSFVSVARLNEKFVTLYLDFTLPIGKAKVWIELDSGFLTGRRVYPATCDKNGKGCMAHLPFKPIIKTQRLFGKPSLRFFAQNDKGLTQQDIPTFNSELLKKMITPVEDNSPNPFSFYKLDLIRR
jgi:hypothetical protein